MKQGVSGIFLTIVFFLVAALVPFLLLVYATDENEGAWLLGFIRQEPQVISIIYVLAVTFFAWLLHHLISSPLRPLQKEAERMSQGDWGTPIKTPKFLGIAIKELQTFGQSLEAVRKKMLQSNQELESQVAERTWDLHIKIHQLTGAEKRISAVNKLLAESSAQNERQRVLLQDVIDNIPVGAIISRSPEAQPEFINHRAHLLLNNAGAGSSYAERYQLYQQDKKTLYDSSQLPINASFRSLKTEYREDIFVKRKNGDWLQLYAQSSVLYDKVGNVELSIMIFDDITARKEIERQKSEFVSVASHQLRTPLSAIKWFVELLLDPKKGELNTEQKDYVENIYHSTSRLIALVNNLLNVSRIESKRVAITPQEVNFSDFLKTLIDEIQPMLHTKKQKLELKELHPIPPISLDPAFVGEAISNILSNASKYSPEDTTITVQTDVNKADLLLSISDQGYGIPQSAHGKVFTKFFRADNVVRKETEGTGLGLYVAQQIILASGGDISFQSEENSGTTFFIKLPLKGTPAVAGEKRLI